MKSRNDAEIKVRLPVGMKSSLQAIADSRLTSEASIVREALLQYLRERGDRLGKPDVGSTAFGSRRTETDSLNETPAVPRSPFRVPRSPKPRKP